jgi:NAD-dependent SIR2 family protein deacetylase
LTDLASIYAHAARLIAGADALIIGAGAGMGVDSGLPDFRGAEGFWRAYPALGRAGISFYEAASPRTFESDPELAWGFYGHRLDLYRKTVPHAGFRLLQDIAARLDHGAFVFTSNVDGQFQKAGFAANQVCECHGSIHHLQCIESCSGDIWPAAGFNPVVDSERCRLTSPLPHCPHCAALARPNILMFGDWGWNQARTDAQESALKKWLSEVSSPVIIELGAGTDVPSVRAFCEGLRAPLIRINPRAPQLGGQRGVGIAEGALAALSGIHAALNASGFFGSVAQ